MDLITAQHLLNEFKILPKVINETTYLEMCRYPTRRFEEICSRILGFFFLPTNEHRLNDLLVKSILQSLPNPDMFQYTNHLIKVIEEEYTEGKRIDLVIVGDNFILGIENKISAILNNPLEIYRKRLEDYKKEHTIGIVLSNTLIKKEAEKLLLEKNEFVNILYSDLFQHIKQNLGFYLNQCNSKYLTFLDDFIKTIENMTGNNILNPDLEDFFYDNSLYLDELIKLYEIFNNRIGRIRLQNLQSLKENLSISTSHVWEIWEDWDLFCEILINNHKILIETQFKTINKNPIGEFKIEITTMNLASWNYFKDSIESRFPNKKHEIIDGRAFVHFDTIINPELPTIENILIALFNELKSIN